MWSILIFIAHFTVFTDSKIIWTTPTTHDFGEILRGKSVTYIFEFKNTSNAPLVIDNVRTDCGCTASDWEETPVEAGAQGRITIHFDASKTGYFKKKITVWIKGMKKAEKLSIEGEVIEE